MNIGTNQEKWLSALESGDYEQGTGRLCKNNKYCCLGVAADIFGCSIRESSNSRGEIFLNFDSNAYHAPDVVLRELKLYDRTGQNGLRPDYGANSLADLNDSGHTFKEIAAIIREKPEAYFKNSN